MSHLLRSLERLRQAAAPLALFALALSCGGHGSGSSTGDAGSCGSSACADSGQAGRPDGAGRRDGGGRHDAGHEDASHRDAGHHDASREDAATRDADSDGQGDGAVDAGPAPGALDPTVATNLAYSSAFLYSGPDAIQTGVATGTIDITRVSVIRGQVSIRSAADGSTDGLAPIAGVTVTVLGHPELGQTTTQSDGWFSVAVNGGGVVTVALQKSGYLPVQRQVRTTWLEYAITNPVVLTPPEPGTAVTLSASSTSFQVVRGQTHGTASSPTATDDADGARTATILIPPGTTASIDALNETSTTLRATELTTGSAGLAAMPADLPPTSAYTYAVDLSIDEANGQPVTFSQPVLFYVDNFIGFPVGDGTAATAVPSGSYDTTQGAWVASPSGQVVKVLTNASGTVTLDVTGAGHDTADGAFTPPLLAGERAQIAALYPAGKTFWRVAVPHFTVWDFNWGAGPPLGAIAPDNGNPNGDSPDDGPCTASGSIIECENQILAEQFPVAGTPFSLRYQSERTKGRAVSVQIPVTGTTPLPSVVTGIEAVVETQGRQWRFHSSSRAANQSFTWTWDRTDGYGRTINGHSDVSVHVGYDYQASSAYQATGSFGEFGNGVPITGNRALREITLWQYETFPIDQIDASTTFGLGGLSLSAQQLYDPFGQSFYGGDGSRRTVDGNHFSVIATYAGGGGGYTAYTGVPATSIPISPGHIAVGPDGTLYIAENAYVAAVDPKTQIITTIGGNGAFEGPGAGDLGNGQPATSVAMAPYGIALGYDGSVYFTTTYTNLVRRIDPSGTLTTVAGTGSTIEYCATGTPCSDGQQATSVPLGYLGDVAVEPGPGGAIYFSEQFTGGTGRVRKVLPDGTLETVVDKLAQPDGLSFGPDGSLYVVDTTNDQVVRRSKSGATEVVAGAGRGNAGDGGPATKALMFYPTDVAVDAEENLFITDTHNSSLRFVDTRGLMRTLTNPNAASVENPVVTDDNGPAGAASLYLPLGVAVGPDGRVYIADSNHDRVRVIRPALPGYSVADAFIPSVDGTVVYQFDETGKHRQTFDALRGQTLETLFYDPKGYLSSLADDAGNVTSISRAQAGSVTSVTLTAPFGQTTTLTLDPSGYVTSLANPNAETVGFTYKTTGAIENGLLATLTDPKGQTHAFTYSSLGLLTEDRNPAGGQRKLVRTNAADGWSVQHTTKMGYVSTYAVSTPAAGGWERDITDPTKATTSFVVGLDGSQTTTISDSLETVLETDVVQVGPDPRYGMVLPVPTSTSVTLQPSGLTMTSTHARTVSVGATFFDLHTQTDVTTVNPGGAQPETLTTTYTAGSPQNTLVVTTTSGRTIATTLDPDDRIVGYAVPGIAPKAITYNTAACPAGGEGCGGRVTSVAATSAGGETRTWTTHYAYSPDTGFASSAVDALGQTISWLRDPVGRVKQTQLEPLAGTRSAQNQLAATYDRNGNLATLAVPSAMSPVPTHTLGYTPIDLLASYAPPALAGGAASGTTYTFNDDGQLTLTTYPSGTVTVGYDASGRLETVLDSVSGVTSTFTYAPGGLPQAVTTSDETLTYGYGPDGPLLMSQAWTGSVKGNVSVTHDSFFRVASRAVNGGTPVTYGFDADGLYAGSTGLVTYTVTRDFNGKNGLLTGSTLGAVTDVLTYDGFGDAATYTATANGGALYSSSVTTRDADGRITAATETLNGKTHSWTYAFDPHGDLASVTEDGQSTAYVFDPNGNRTSAGGGTSTYDAQDRLLASPTAAYSYSTNGDLETRVASGKTTTYAYDLVGALRQVTLPSGDTVSYVIDGRSRRVGRTWKHGAKTVTQGFLYDDQLHVAAELDGSGNVVSTFIYGTRANVPDAMVRGGKTYRILSDWRGSVRAVVDASSGAVQESLDYDAWGNATDSDVTCASGAVCAPFQPFGFAGGLFDRQTGLTRFGARDYDPSVGRWTQKDRSGLSAGPNVYAYASGDPVDFVDMDGHRSFSCGSVLVGGLEGAVNDLAAQAFRAAANSFCDPGGSSTDINWGEVAQAAALGALGGALSGNCFEAGTLVATCANGEQPIETLREGDEVLSRNAETGETACRQVVHTYVHDADDVARLRVSADDGGEEKEESFAVTLGHPFWVDGRGWTPVRELAPGDGLATAAGEARVVVGGWVAEGGSGRVFNLEVEGDHSYFVGRGGVWVHNGCGPPASAALAQEVSQAGGGWWQTVALVETEEGPTLVGAGGTDLSADQKAVAQGLGLTVVEDLPGAHAEVTVIQGAANLGLTPTTGYSTNLVCSGSCGPMITGMGGWVNGRHFGF